MNKLATLALILAALAAFPSAADAKPRPTVDQSDGSDCFADPDADVDYPPPGESAIMSCCYDDGCWICSTVKSDCVWDPKYRVMQPTGDLTVKPGGIKLKIVPKGSVDGVSELRLGN